MGGETFTGGEELGREADADGGGPAGAGMALVHVGPRPKGVYTQNALKRQFSESYARAMAAVLNVRCSVFPSGDDIDSVDVEFDSGRFGPGGVPLGINRKLETQLKCTTTAQLTAMNDPLSGVACWRYYLAVSDYTRLAIAADQRPYPHVLVVVRVPPLPADWMRCQGHLTVLRAKAWWLDLTDAPDPKNLKNEAVYLPQNQVFDVAALDGLMREPQ
jgi:hypothetical protein